MNSKIYEIVVFYIMKVSFFHIISGPKMNIEVEKAKNNVVVVSKNCYTLKVWEGTRLVMEKSKIFCASWVHVTNLFSTGLIEVPCVGKLG